MNRIELPLISAPFPACLLWLPLNWILIQVVAPQVALIPARFPLMPVSFLSFIKFLHIPIRPSISRWFPLFSAYSRSFLTLFLLAALKRYMENCSKLHLSLKKILRYEKWVAMSREFTFYATNKTDDPQNQKLQNWEKIESLINLQDQNHLENNDLHCTSRNGFVQKRAFLGATGQEPFMNKS